jgi:hypothetical protein
MRPARPQPPDRATRNHHVRPSITSDFAVGHAGRSIDAGFDRGEIAYRKGSFTPIPGIGLTGRGDDDFIGRVADRIGPERTGLILHPRNTDGGDLPAMYRAGARLVRICVTGKDLAPAVNSIAQAKDLGFTVIANLTRVSQVALAELADTVGQLAEACPDVVYLADSNGSLSPQQVAALVLVTTSAAPNCAVGFHAHNNLGLALANALAAVENGAGWIDSAVLYANVRPISDLMDERFDVTIIRENTEGLYAGLDLYPAPEAARAEQVEATERAIAEAVRTGTPLAEARQQFGYARPWQGKHQPSR